MAASLKHSFALTEIVLATAIWGFGFIAAIWGLESFSPLAITSVRFIVASLLGWFAILLLKPLRKNSSWKIFFAGFWPGIFLGACLLFQTWGQVYTTPTNSGFITVLYVLFVPVIDRFIFKRPVHPLHSVFVLLALVGAAFIVRFDGFSNLNKGDLLTLVCALAASFQIIALEKVSPKFSSSFVLNASMNFWAGIFPAILALIFIHRLPLKITAMAFTGLAFLTLFSTFLAFFLQVRGQRSISATQSSILFLLESPFAAFFSVLILHEKLGGFQILGALLIVVSAVGAIRLQISATKREALPLKPG